MTSLPFRPSGGVPVLPLVFRLAARIEQVGVRELLTDPGVRTRALRTAQRLFGYDGVINTLDPSLEAEACGAAIEWRPEPELPAVVSQPWKDDSTVARFDPSALAGAGRVSVVVEATKRLVQELRSGPPVVGVVSGPLTLAFSLRGQVLREELADGKDVALDALDLAGQAIVAISRQYLEAGARAVLVVESAPGLDDPDVAGELQSVLRSLWNVTGYFQAPGMLLVAGPVSDGAALTLRDLGGDVLILDTGPGDVLTAPVASGGPAVGAALPPALLEGPAAELEGAFGALRTDRASPVIVSTAGEVPYSAAPERIHDLVRLAHGVRGVGR